MKRCALLLVALLALLPGWSDAQEQLVSASNWIVSGNAVTLRYTFPREIEMHLTKHGAPTITIAMMGRYVLEHASVLQGVSKCAAVDQGYDLGLVDPLYAGPDLHSFEILFLCPAAGGALVLRNDALFDVDRPHMGLASIRIGAATPVSRLITASDRDVHVARGQADASGAGAYMQLGAKHLFTRLVHWCTVCGLFLLARGRREWLFLAAGILGGYSIAAVLSGFGNWVLQPGLAEAWDGFLVLLVAAFFTARGTGSSGKAAAGLVVLSFTIAAICALRSESGIAITLAGAGVFGASVVYLWRDLERQPARWLIPATALGLIDGFSLSSAFAPLHNIAALGAMHVGAFNLGAVLAVFAMSCIAFVVRAALRRHARLLVKPFFGDLLTATLAAVGCFCVLTA